MLVIETMKLNENKTFVDCINAFMPAILRGLLDKESDQDKKNGIIEV